MRASLGLWGLAAVMVVAACGHKAPPPTEQPDNTIGGGDTTPPPDTSGNMVSPDKVDEVNRDLARKRDTVSRCLSEAVDNHELPRNSKGQITLEIVIEGSHASDIKIVKASLDSKSLNQCVLAKVKEIEFPALEHRYETSYTYEFEAI